MHKEMVCEENSLLAYNAFHVSDKYVFMLQSIIINDKSLLITLLIPSESSSLIDVGANPSPQGRWTVKPCLASPHPGRGAEARTASGPVGCSRYLPLWCAAPLGAPLATRDFLLHLTVLGQRLVGRPRADVDRDEDEEEEAGCRGGHSEELHWQRSLLQPRLRGSCEALRCHGNAAAPRRNRAFIT